VDLAVVQMQLTSRGAGALHAAVERANRGGRNPAVRVELLEGDVARVVCDTYPPMLVSRISDAFEAELGAGWEHDAAIFV
jgi:hypothetical protein